MQNITDLKPQKQHLSPRECWNCNRRFWTESSRSGFCQADCEISFALRPHSRRAYTEEKVDRNSMRNSAPPINVPR
jgi:hypothetical protein